jgi:hypothetical protein
MQQQQQAREEREEREAKREERDRKEREERAERTERAERKDREERDERERKNQLFLMEREEKERKFKLEFERQKETEDRKFQQQMYEKKSESENSKNGMLLAVLGSPAIANIADKLLNKKELDLEKIAGIVAPYINSMINRKNPLEDSLPNLLNNIANTTIGISTKIAEKAIEQAGGGSISPFMEKLNAANSFLKVVAPSVLDGYKEYIKIRATYQPAPIQVPLPKKEERAIEHKEPQIIDFTVAEPEPEPEPPQREQKPEPEPDPYVIDEPQEENTPQISALDLMDMKKLEAKLDRMTPDQIYREISAYPEVIKHIRNSPEVDEALKRTNSESIRQVIQLIRSGG